MKILVVGAGALGGYFGGRLIQAGQDVTFLLRPNRVKQLQASGGLHIKSDYGDFSVPSPVVIQTEQINHHYDLIIVSCKAFDLDGCMDSFAAAVGTQTMILPVLNGVRHIERLVGRFGQERVLGGLCRISATLNEQGHILHLNKAHDLIFGELNSEETPRVQALKDVLTQANFDGKYSDNIVQDMWNKWIFIATAAGMTCLFRAAVCDIVKAKATYFILDLLRECTAIATYHGFEPDEANLKNIHTMMTDPNSTLTASMLKDMEKGNNIEAEAIIGDFIRRTPEEQKSGFPMLNIVYAHLHAYLARRAREVQ